MLERGIHVLRLDHLGTLLAFGSHMGLNLLPGVKASVRYHQICKPLGGSIGFARADVQAGLRG